MIFYVYLHLDPRTNDVRYVGVGSKSRAYDWQGRNAGHRTWIAELDALELEPVVSLPGRTRDRDEALEIEQQLIAWHRKRGSALFNITAGGLGARGVVRTEAQKQYSRDVQAARWLFDPEFRAKQLKHMETARHALAERNRSPEHRAKITRHRPINGTPCGRCGGTLRYASSRNCVRCAKRP